MKFIYHVKFLKEYFTHIILYLQWSIFKWCEQLPKNVYWNGFLFLISGKPESIKSNISRNGFYQIKNPFVSEI